MGGTKKYEKQAAKRKPKPSNMHSPSFLQLTLLPASHVVVLLEGAIA